MTGSTAPSEKSPPIANMRVTLWGVQGSFPVFPTPYGVRQYARRLGQHILAGVFHEMRIRGRACTVEEVLGGAESPPTYENLLNRIGLPHVPIYGGDTTCIQIETSEGNVIFLDAGSGIRRASVDLVHRWSGRKGRQIHLFGSHEHLDHRIGLAFSQFCYADDDPYLINVYGTYAFLHTLDNHYGVFARQTSESTYIDDPIDFRHMSARFVGLEFVRDTASEGDRQRHWGVRDMSPVHIGSTTITPFEVYHVIPMCLGYRVEHNGRVFIFATDHERRRGPDPEDPRQKRSLELERNLLELSRDADMAYYDGQYFLDEYMGRAKIGPTPALSRLDWGHTCIEDVVERVAAANVKQALIGHHDPDRTWPERLEIDRHLSRLCRGEEYSLQLAESDSVFDL